MNIKKWVVALALIILGFSGPGIALASGTHKASDKALHLIGVKVGDAFNFEPFDPPLPNHLWMQTDPDKMVFFHFAKAASEGDNNLLFMGDAIKGRFCKEDQPQGGKTGYVHFHSLRVEKGHKHGHGGEKGQEGYWLRHIALGEFDAMKIHFKPGIAHNFKATAAPSCQ